MSERLFTPAYTVEGVTYTENGTAGKKMDPQVTTVGVGKGLDANQYATKKTVAQGMLDVALLTANASQLKYVLSVGEQHEFYTIMLALIITSLILQLMVGILSLSLSMLRDCRLHMSNYHRSANIISHINLASVFIIASLNGLTAVLLGPLAILNITKRKHQRAAKILNHVILTLNMLTLAADAIKMGFNNGMVLVGVLFMIIGMMNINDPGQQKAANILNNFIVVFIFIISVENVILSAFGIENMNLNPPGIPVKLNTTQVK